MTVMTMLASYMLQDTTTLALHSQTAFSPSRKKGLVNSLYHFLDTVRVIKDLKLNGN